MNHLNQSKAWLRNYFRQLRREISSSLQKKHSQTIATCLIKSDLFRNAKTIALYLDFGSEVKTGAIVKAAWSLGKTVLIPDTRKGIQKPTFMEYRYGDRLKKTTFGPSELVQMRKPFGFKKISLILVPGLAFDPKGFRLGYGGGVYDIYLRRSRGSYALGLFYSCQEIHALPRSPNDQKLSSIFTELTHKTFTG